MFFALEPEICNNTISDNFLSDEISLELSGEAGVLVFDGSSLGCDAHPEILQRLAAKVTGCVGVGELGTTSSLLIPPQGLAASIRVSRVALILLGLLPHEGRPDPDLLLESLDITLGRDGVEHFFQDGVVAPVRSCSSAAVWPRLPAILRSPYCMSQLLSPFLKTTMAG